MTVDDRECRECGSSEWSEVFDKSYPERRRERDQTVQTVYVCTECDAEGKHFEHPVGGKDTYSGAFR